MGQHAISAVARTTAPRSIFFKTMKPARHRNLPFFTKSPSVLALLHVITLTTISTDSFQYSNNFHRSYSISNENGALFLPPRRRASSTVSWASSSPQFSVGEEVMFMDDDGATQRIGVVEQKRGGWYTVRLKRDNAKSVKRRGSQIQNKPVSAIGSDSQPTTASDPANNSDAKGVDEQSTEPTAEIVDLDFIIHSMQQEHIEGDRIHNQSSTVNELITTDTIDQIMNCHSQYNQWIIFSDLHVMPSTLSICLQILDRIHNAAIEANAGILFLGDFWHHRGFVRVDCLNAILDAMSKWTVPCIMIPGNHDQIDWKGVEHALSPLSNSYRITSPNQVDSNGPPRKYYGGPLIISHPTKFLGALFVPHTRDKSMMKSILSSKAAASSTALFVHADIKGASMNDLIQSQHGLPASIFPKDKHVYSGHFHKPHVVRAGKKSSNCISIRYVGSPYQTSFSEAGQAKSLLLVDSRRRWQCVEELPIDLGPRYHRLSSIHRFLESSGANFRQGDKVAVTVCQQEVEEMRIRAATEETSEEKSSFDTKLEELRKAGITVEIRDSQPQSQDGVAEILPSSDDNEVGLEDLSPKATIAAYLDNEVENGELGGTTAKMLLEKGVEMLGGSSLSLNAPSSDAIVTELEIESVSVLGFGSFCQKAVYPLKNRGVVLLRGTNKDFGSDSNGVGKSTLAMASLWALAGSTDPRPTQDGKVTDVVNDFSKIAEVTLHGFINSKPFVVKRIKSTSSRASSLTFLFNGLDLTRQSSKDTQALINEHFNMESPQILMRTIFHGQHTIGGLLESSDSKFKEELSYLVSLDIWQQSASFARSKQRELKQRASELGGMLSLRGNDRKRAEEKSHSAKAETERRESILEHERVAFAQKKQCLPMESDASSVEKNMNLVQTQLRECENEIDGFEREKMKYMDAGNKEVRMLRSKLNEMVATENLARGHEHACQREHDATMIELKSAERQLRHLQSEWNASTSAEDISICRTCGQAVTSATAQNHVIESIEEKLNAATSLVKEASESACVASVACAEAKEDVAAKALVVRSCMEDIHQAEESLTHETDGLRKEIKRVRMLQSDLSAEFACLARKAKEISEFNLRESQMQANLNRLSEALNSSENAYKDCCAELKMVETNIAELEKDEETTTAAASFNSLLADAFGPKGIQAFVLRNTVEALQYCSQAYLDELSDGSLQLRMQVGSNDSITKQAAVRNPDGTWRVRPLSSLSGGQWRRCSLSLSLGFIDLASKRGKLRSSLLVLDEPLTHLDSAGRKSVGQLLRKMLSKGSSVGKTHGISGFGLSTILVILQEIAAEEIEECFDQVDEVIKRDGESFVILDENQAESPA